MTDFDHDPAALLLGQDSYENNCFDQSNLSNRLQVNLALQTFVYIRSLMIQASLLFVWILHINA